MGSPLYSSRTKIGVASIVCDNPETRTVRLLFAEAHRQPSSPFSVEQLQQTDWSDAMTVLPELRQQIWHPAPAARRSREKLK